jgi:hypothetical protein
MTSPIPATRTVPDTSARTPHDWGLISADQWVPVKNSTGLTSRKNSKVWNASTAMMPIVVTTPNAAAPKSSTSMIRSLMGWRRVRELAEAVIRCGDQPPTAASHSAVSFVRSSSGSAM